MTTTNTGTAGRLYYNDYWPWYYNIPYPVPYPVPFPMAPLVPDQIPASVREEKPMNGRTVYTLYRVYVVDALKHEVVDEDLVIGGTPQDAISMIELDPDVREAKKREPDRYKILVNELGKYEEYIQKVQVQATNDASDE